MLSQNCTAELSQLPSLFFIFFSLHHFNPPPHSHKCLAELLRCYTMSLAVESLDFRLQILGALQTNQARPEMGPAANGTSCLMYLSSCRTFERGGKTSFLFNVERGQWDTTKDFKSVKK
ncbi:hypothetical protein GOODEAATRI_000342 [Goodea atripinnis]|uniref:Uncharacterized protein n=1 Tax=Goodea atripinnis TaxID=208336 RepID=A0ABV0MDU1_9TELE